MNSRKKVLLSLLTILCMVLTAVGYLGPKMVRAAGTAGLEVRDNKSPGALSFTNGAATVNLEKDGKNGDVDITIAITDVASNSLNGTAFANLPVDKPITITASNVADSIKNEYDVVLRGGGGINIPSPAYDGETATYTWNIASLTALGIDGTDGHNFLSLSLDLNPKSGGGSPGPGPGGVPGPIDVIIDGTWAATPASGDAATVTFNVGGNTVTMHISSSSVNASTRTAQLMNSNGDPTELDTVDLEGFDRDTMEIRVTGVENWNDTFSYDQGRHLLVKEHNGTLPSGTLTLKVQEKGANPPPGPGPGPGPGGEEPGPSPDDIVYRMKVNGGAERKVRENGVVMPLEGESWSPTDMNFNFTVVGYFSDADRNEAPDDGGINVNYGEGFTFYPNQEMDYEGNTKGTVEENGQPVQKPVLQLNGFANTDGCLSFGIESHCVDLGLGSDDFYLTRVSFASGDFRGVHIEQSVFADMYQSTVFSDVVQVALTQGAPNTDATVYYGNDVISIYGVDHAITAIETVGSFAPGAIKAFVENDYGVVEFHSNYYNTIPLRIKMDDGEWEYFTLHRVGMTVNMAMYTDTDTFEGPVNGGAEIKGWDVWHGSQYSTATIPEEQAKKYNIVASFYYDEDESYKDYQVVANLVFADGSTRTVVADGYGEMHSMNGPTNGGDYLIFATDTMSELPTEVNVTAVRTGSFKADGSTASSFNGASFGAGKGITATLGTRDDNAWYEIK